VGITRESTRTTDRPSPAEAHGARLFGGYFHTFYSAFELINIPLSLTYAWKSLRDRFMNNFIQENSINGWIGFVRRIRSILASPAEI